MSYKTKSVLYEAKTNNGHLSTFFKLSRGIRQGCPISALLFLSIAEVVVIKLKNSDEVEGTNLKGQNIKLWQLADDLTLSLSSAVTILRILQICRVKIK